MFSTLLAVFGFVALAAGIFGFFKAKDKYGDPINHRWLIPVVGVVAALACILPVTVGSVDAKEEGVVTSLRKPTGETKKSGGYVKLPWQQVHGMSTAQQNEPYSFDVQMAGGAKATLNVYPSWEIIPEKAPELYQQHKSFEKVTTDLFAQQLVSEANNIFSVYNPVKDIDPKTGEAKTSKKQWGDKLKKALDTNTLLAGRIQINSVSIPIIQPDGDTQKNLNSVLTEYAKGGVLDQQKANVEKEKEIAAEQVKIPNDLFCMRENSKNGLDAGTCLGGNSIIVDSRKK